MRGGLRGRRVGARHREGGDYEQHIACCVTKVLIVRVEFVGSVASANARENMKSVNMRVLTGGTFCRALADEVYQRCRLSRCVLFAWTSDSENTYRIW